LLGLTSTTTTGAAGVENKSAAAIHNGTQVLNSSKGCFNITVTTPHGTELDDQGSC
jgi:hypothetical protein